MTAERKWWVIQVLFALSGACALTYEITWGRWLATVLGTSSVAACVLLSAYMGGLALGAWSFGRISRRTRAPMIAYALVELLIGAVALCVPPATELALGFPEALRVTVSVLLLTIPTFLMGGTVPLVLAWSEAEQLPGGRTLGRLYGLNTLGAAAGCFITGLALIPAIGLSNTNRLAAAINAVIAVVSLVLGRIATAPAKTPLSSAGGVTGSRAGGPDAAAAPTGDVPPAADAPRAALHALAFISGFVTLGLEVLWIRLLRISLGSTTYIFTLVIGTFILGIGLGGVLAGRVAEKSEVEPRLARAQLVVATLLLLTFALLPRTRPLLYAPINVETGAWMVELFRGAMIAGVLLLPLTTVMGYMFPLLGRLYMRRGHRGSEVGALYTVNTIGSVLGALLLTVALIPVVGSPASFLVLIALALVSLVIYARLLGARRTRRFVAAAAVVIAGFIAAAVVRPGWTPRYLGFNTFMGHDFDTNKVLFFAEGRVSTVVVDEVQDAQRMRLFRVDGKPEATTGTFDRANQILLGDLPALLHPAPKTGLVVGLGTGMTLGALAAHGLESVDIVELEPLVASVARFFDEHNGAVLDRKNVNLIIDDGFNYLHASDKKYDVITSDPIQPFYRGAATLYTRDYFERCRSRLAEGGVVAHWLPMERAHTEDLKMIVRGFADVFPHVRLYWTGGEENTILLGRMVPFESSEIDAQRYEPARSRLASVFVGSHQELGALFVADRPQLVAWAGEGPRNTIDHPLLEFTAPRALHMDTGRRNFAEILELRKQYGRKDDAFTAITTVLAHESVLNRMPDKILAGQLLFDLARCAPGTADCPLAAASSLLRRRLWRHALQEAGSWADRFMGAQRIEPMWWSKNSGLDSGRLSLEYLEKSVTLLDRASRLVGAEDERRVTGGLIARLLKLVPPGAPFHARLSELSAGRAAAAGGTAGDSDGTGG